MNQVIQAPDAVCAQSVLGFAAHSVQGYANIIIDGRMIPLNEFFLSICARSGRKSECDSTAGDCHTEYQKELYKNYNYEKKLYEDECQTHDTARKKIMDDKKTSKSEKNDLLSVLRAEEPWKPYEPLIRISDPTTEGIHKGFERGYPSKFLCADEGGQFSGGHSMKSENKLYTATTYSKYWDGAPVDRVRGGDGASILYGCRLSVHLMMQTQVAMNFFNDQETRDQGLTSRFLVVYPESLTGGRHYKAVNTKETPEMVAYCEHIKKNLNQALPLKIDEKTGKELNQLDPRNIHLSQDAKKSWIAAYEDIEAESGKGKAFESIQGFAGKASAHILRLAGILALFEDISRPDIPIEYISQARTLMEYYLTERLRITKMAAPQQDMINARQLLDWLQERRTKIITLPDVYQSGPYVFRDKNQAMESLQILEEHYWIEPLKNGGVSEINQKKRQKAWAVYDGKI